MMSTCAHTCSINIVFPGSDGLNTMPNRFIAAESRMTGVGGMISDSSSFKPGCSIGVKEVLFKPVHDMKS